MALLWQGVLDTVAVVGVLGLLLCMEVGFRFLPNEERWALSISPDCNVKLDDRGGLIEFEGLVGPKGRFGHKGIMRRKVQIIRVVRFCFSRP
ncbi:MAG: hypothetical protein K8T89_08350 [Planctomycetes bacterium]|nr:hypothetical protein [Planctomycetota bacterium]